MFTLKRCQNTSLFAGGIAPHVGQAVKYCCLIDLVMAWEATLEE